METDIKAPSVKLEWSRLLGFDQASQAQATDSAKRLNDPRLIKLGAKFGGKPGLRLSRI